MKVIMRGTIHTTLQCGTVTRARNVRWIQVSASENRNQMRF